MPQLCGCLTECLKVVQAHCLHRSIQDVFLIFVIIVLTLLFGITVLLHVLKLGAVLARLDDLVLVAKVDARFRAYNECRRLTGLLNGRRRGSCRRLRHLNRNRRARRFRNGENRLLRFNGSRDRLGNLRLYRLCRYGLYSLCSLILRFNRLFLDLLCGLLGSLLFLLLVLLVVIIVRIRILRLSQLLLQNALDRQQATNCLADTLVEKCLHLAVAALAIQSTLVGVEQLDTGPEQAAALTERTVNEMLQLRNCDLDTAALLANTDGCKDLRMRNENGRHKLLQLIARHLRDDRVRLTLHLIHIPFGNLLKQLLKLAQVAVRIRLLALRLLQKSHKLAVERRNQEE